MTQALPYPEHIAESSSMTVNSKAVIVQFESYASAAPRGINPNEDVWTINYLPTDQAMTREIMAVFYNVGAYGLVSWTADEVIGEKIYRVVAGSLKCGPAPNEGGMSVISLQLNQTFVHG